MVIDAVTDRLFGQPYDRDGQIAASGAVLEPVVSASAARNHFSAANRLRPRAAKSSDASSRSNSSNVADARVRQMWSPRLRLLRHDRSPMRCAASCCRVGGRFRELIVSGGGANNPTLMAMLANELRPLHLTIRASDEFGLPSEAKEAVAFALLAYETWHHRPSNVPSATGARAPGDPGEDLVCVTGIRKNCHPERRWRRAPRRNESRGLRLLFAGVNDNPGSRLCCSPPLRFPAQQARPQHAGNDHREQPNQSRSARRSGRAIGAYRRAHLRRPAYPRRALRRAPGTGRTLGHSRSADLRLPPASRRQVSRRPRR